MNMDTQDNTQKTFAEKLAERAEAQALNLSRFATLATGKTAAASPVVITYQLAPAEPMKTEDQMLLATIVASELAGTYRLSANGNAVSKSLVVPGSDPARRYCAAAFKGMHDGQNVTIDVFESKSNTPKIVIKGISLPAQYTDEGWYESHRSG
jgi:hypothetical protein